jgi:hypothetical protein
MFCNAEKGTYTEVDSGVFRMWRKKLQQHEEKAALMANYTYRNQKRQEKTWLFKKHQLVE